MDVLVNLHGCRIGDLRRRSQDVIRGWVRAIFSEYRLGEGSAAMAHQPAPE